MRQTITIEEFKNISKTLAKLALDRDPEFSKKADQLLKAQDIDIGDFVTRMSEYAMKPEQIALLDLSNEEKIALSKKFGALRRNGEFMRWISDPSKIQSIGVEDVENEDTMAANVAPVMVPIGAKSLDRFISGPKKKKTKEELESINLEDLFAD